MATDKGYSFNSIRTDIEETKETTVFFSPVDEKFTEINLDTALREQVSKNTANIAEHEKFISENNDISSKIDSLQQKIDNYDNSNYVVHEDFDGNIINTNVVDDLEKIVNDIRQKVYELIRDYGTHLNTGDLKYENQLATETLEELRDLIEDSQENLLPIRDVVNEVKDSRLTYFTSETKTSLKERLIADFNNITDQLDKLAEFEDIKTLINNLQEQINDIIENGVRQDIIDDIYDEIDKIKEDIEWLKENGGGHGPGPTPEADLPDAKIIQQCLNVFLITNTTLFRMRSVVEDNQDLIDYIVFQITQDNIPYEKIEECYPYLREKIRDKLINTAMVNYSIKKNSLINMTIPQLATEYAADIEEETTTEKLNRLIQVTLNVFIKTNATTVRTREVQEEERGLVDYIVAQALEGRMDLKEACNDYPHLAEEIFNKFMEMGGE